MKKTSNLRSIVGALIITSAFSAVIAGSMRSSTLQSFPVSEVRAADASGHSYVGRRLRLVGFIGRGKVLKQPSLTAGGVVDVNHFSIVEKGFVVQVAYRDALPDAFRPGGPVQVDGLYTAPGSIEADRVLTKCPSKYDSEGKYQKTRAATSS